MMSARLPMSARLQIAADLVGTLADAVDEIGALLERIHAELGDELYAKVSKAFPLEYELGPKSGKALAALSRELEGEDAHS